MEAIAIRMEAIASRMEAIAIRMEAIASRMEAIAIILGWRPLLFGGAGLRCARPEADWGPVRASPNPKTQMAWHSSASEFIQTCVDRGTK